jgi:cell division protein FtsA
MNTLTTQSTSRSGDSNRPRMLPDQPSPASRARIAGTPGLRASGPFGVLDIGTTKIVCIIGRIEGDGTPRVLGLGNRQGQGINGGSITDIEKAERAIRAAVGEAEEMADTRLRNVIVNLSCGQPTSRLLNVKCDVGGRAVTEQDIRGALSLGRARAAAEGRQIVHMLPLGYAADDVGGIGDPRGLFCETLGTQLHVIDTATTSIRTLQACLQRCDLGLAELVSAPMAAGLATLVEDEKQIGATVLDMGGGSTGMAIFADGQLLHTSQIPMGGINVTAEIARQLSTSFEHAERLKTFYGSAQSSPDDLRETVPVKPVGEAEHHIATIPRAAVVSIIIPSMERIFSLVRDRLEQFGPDIGTRVVLTGGASQLTGVREMAAGFLDRPVRLGLPAAVRDLPVRGAGADFATAVGLLAWAAGMGHPAVEIGPDTDRSGGLLRRIVQFLRERT